MKLFIYKEKSIYQELNKLQSKDNILIGYFWCPTKMSDTLFKRLEDIKVNRNVLGPQVFLVKDFRELEFVRPTHIETNEFTWPF